MMGPRQTNRPKLFYTGFNLEERIRSDHPLRKISAAVDFNFVRLRVKSLYGRRGNPSVDPAVLLKLMFLLFYENVPSERALMERLPERLDWLWFCGYDLEDPIPDHSVLSKGRRRWGKAVFEEFFQRILRQCVEAGLVDGTVVHIDSSMIAGNAGKDKLQVYLRGVAGAVYEQLDRAEDAADPDFPAALNVSSASAPFAEGSPQSEGSISETPKPGQRITPVDPDARLGSKGGRSTLGYKDHRAVDDRCGIITATVTTPANVADEQMLMEAIETHEANTDMQVETACTDKIYGTGANYKALQERGITPCIPHKAKNCHVEPAFANDRFTYDEAADECICPAGQRLRRKRLDPDKNAVIYQAPREVCRACIFLARCVLSQTAGRRVSRNLNDPYTAWADGCLSPGARKRLLGRRKAKVEGSFADAANNHGFKRARWRSLLKVTIQNLLIAAMQNLRKLLKAAGSPPKLGQSGFSAARHDRGRDFFIHPTILCDPLGRVGSIPRLSGFLNIRKAGSIWATRP